MAFYQYLVKNSHWDLTFGFPLSLVSDISGPSEVLIQTGSYNKYNSVSLPTPVFYGFSLKCALLDCISIWIHEDGFCLPLNLRGILHHILTAISGTICFTLADITRIWTDLTLKCYNTSLYYSIEEEEEEGTTQPTTNWLCFFKQMFQSKKKKRKNETNR